MATTDVNNTEADEQPNGKALSEGNELNAVRSVSTQQNVEAPIFINGTNNSSTTEDTVTESQSQDKEKENPSSCFENASVAENSRETTEAQVREEKTKKKYNNILDSDSEEEDAFIASLLKKNKAAEASASLESEMKKTIAAKPKNSSRRFAVIDSESEDEDSAIPGNNANNDGKDSGSEENSSNEPAAKKTSKPKFRTTIDTDSEDDDDSKPSEKSQEENDEKTSSSKSPTAKGKKKQKISSIVDSTSDDEDESEGSDVSSSAKKSRKVASNRKNKTKTDKKIVKSKISSLIDTDSEDDVDRSNVERSMHHEQHGNENPEKKPEKSAKKRTGSIRSSKDEAMRQIHSETQRLIRSTEISLPYHKPKQRSLQEFLNRKQFIPALPQGLTTAAKVKMASQLVGKILEEKEKEAELFYKSSDSEEEAEVVSTPANPQAETEESSSGRHLIVVKSIEHFNIEDTQRILKNDVQNAHNKKEIIQQGAVDVGVPRKLLFAKETEDTVATAGTEAERDNEQISECEDPKKKNKEAKHDFRETSVPRKLFGSDYNDAVTPSNFTSESVAANSPSNENAEKNPEKSNSTLESSTESLVTSPISKLQNPNAKNVIEIDESSSNAISNENNEFSNISETPFIRNKELAKFNEKESAPRHLDDSTEEFEDADDLSESATPIGHVLGLPPPEFETSDSRSENSSNKPKLLSSLSKPLGPKLRGSPGTFIDLSSDVRPNKDGVQSLLDRFLRHSVTTNKSAEANSPVTVIHTEKTAEGLKIVEEVLSYKPTTGPALSGKDLEKPGAKHQRLRNELIDKMAKKRDEQWKSKKQQEQQENLEEDEEEVEDEEEAEDKPPDPGLRVSSESEPEEDDLPAEKRRKRKSCEFADDEAEVSADDEEDEEMQVDEETDDDDEENDVGGEIEEDDAASSDDLSDPEEATASKRKKPSRVLKAFEDDSNSLPEGEIRAFERTKTDVDIFASDTDPQISSSQTQPDDRHCKSTPVTEDVFKFVTPITQLTVLNSRTDSPRVDKNSPLAQETRGPRKTSGVEEKLFENSSGAISDDDLLDLCSGKFTGTEGEAECSGSLGKLSAQRSASRAVRPSALEKSDAPAGDEASPGVKLTVDDSSSDFRGKLDGEKSANGSKTPWVNSKVASSSDEENSRENANGENAGRKKVKRKKVQRLELSDDDVSSSSEEEEAGVGLDNEEDVKYVDYDSEENEVVIVPGKDVKKVAAGFLDEEAELSESEWGSADEDEKDLDKLEVEEGDDEEIDENQMRDELGKMHMRQVLDDDQREVRMLQELLFDDGDLHAEGGGRERQFRWKNIDKLGDDDKLGPRADEPDEGAEVIEEDDDLEWRKQRLERDKFIEEKMKNSSGGVNDELESDSPIFQLGMKALEKSKSIHTSQNEPKSTLTKKPIVPRTVFDLLGSSTTGKNSGILNKAAKRGSFLARGEQSLARIAIHVKHSEPVITTRKDPRKFVFLQISPSVAGTADKEQKEETKTDEDPPAVAKGTKRKPPAGATPRRAKKAKVEVSTGKKLF